MTAVHQKSVPKPAPPKLKAVAQPAVTTEIVDVSPVLAEEWLGHNTRNRHLKPTKIAQYQRAMERGEWRMTGEGIKFSPDGALLDGQNRLAAVVASGRTSQMLVVRGIPAEAQDVMDTGAARTIGDQLTIHGFANAATLGSSTRTLVLWTTGRFYVERIQQAVTHQEMLDFAAGNHALAHAVQRGITLRKIVGASPTAIAAAYYRLSEVDEEAAEEFFQRAADGVGLPAGSPILALRARLQKAQQDRAHIPVIPMISLIVRAWNAWRDGKSVGHLKLIADGQYIHCPEPK